MNERANEQSHQNSGCCQVRQTQDPRSNCLSLAGYNNGQAELQCQESCCIVEQALSLKQIHHTLWQAKTLGN